MTNQNTTSPALHRQNQPPDSGSVHESRWKLWLSRHRSHRHTCCVFFCLECFTIFRGEKRRSLFTARPSATKSPFLLMSNQNITNPALYHQNQPSDSGSVHESQRRNLWLSLHRSHRHTCCVCFYLDCFTIFRGEKRESLYCSSSSYQKSVSADDKSKHNKPSPLSPEPTSSLWLCTLVTAAAALALAASQSPPYVLCVLCFTISRADKRRNRYVSPPQDFREGCHLKILGQDFAKRAHFRSSENLGKIFRQHFYP